MEEKVSQEYNYLPLPLIECSDQIKYFSTVICHEGEIKDAGVCFVLCIPNIVHHFIDSGK